jgi:4-hydroxybenzoate polyprenyltransferase
MKLSVALRLGRVSNLPTVWSNVLAGLVLAKEGGGALASFWLVVGFSALYTAGMYLNDAFDATFDRIHRSERPIPSGEASAMSVFVAGFAMLAAGLAIVGAVALLRLGPDSKPAIFSAAGLAAVIVLYDAWHKRNPLGPALMGLCRLLVYCTTALAIAGSLSWSVLSAAIAAFCYLIGLTYIAKQETLGRLTNLWPLGFLAVPFVYEALEATVGTITTLSSIALFVWIGYALYLLRPPTRAIGRAVGFLIAGISLLDAMFIAGQRQPALALVAALCFALTLAFQRLVSGT